MNSLSKYFLIKLLQARASGLEVDEQGRYYTF